MAEFGLQAAHNVVSLQEPQSYNNRKVLTFNIHSVKFKDAPNGVELIAYDRNPKDTEVE